MSGTIPMHDYVNEPDVSTPVSYAQIETVVRMLLKEGYHVVPATENTTRVALRASQAASLFTLGSVR